MWYAGAAAGIGVQAIRCRTFLHRSYNWTKGKSKNRRFLAAFFSIFLSLLKEIWPPEAYMQDAGAARNRRTENGPSGTPAPTEDQTRARRYSKVRRCGPSGTPAPTEDQTRVRRYSRVRRCGYDNGARHHQCGTRERQRCQFKDSWRDLRAPPRGTRERQRGREYKRFGAEPFCTAVTIGRKEIQRP